MELKSFCKVRTLSIDQNGNLLNDKIFLPTYYIWQKTNIPNVFLKIAKSQGKKAAQFKTGDISEQSSQKKG